MDYEKVLIAIWLKGENLEFLDDFKESDFQIYPHVFKALCEVRHDDLVHIARLSKESVAALMGIVSDYGFSPSLFTGAYKAVKDRRIRSMIAELAANPQNTPEQIERIMQEIQNTDIDSEEIILTPAEEYNLLLEARHQRKKIFYGVSRIDRVTGGLRPKELTVIAARPGVGKTAFALKVASSVAQQGHKVFFFSLEMARVQLIERFICWHSGVDGTKLKNPEKLDSGDWLKINDAYSMIPQNLRIYEREKTLERIARLIKKYRPELVIIDQLSHIKTREFRSVREKYMYLTNMLKDWTMELDVPIILLAQINRSGQDRLPSLADLKDSGSIEEDADNIFILHRLSKDEAENTKIFAGTYDSSILNGRHPFLVALAKHRNGELKRFPMCYHGKRFIFEEIS